MSKMKLCILFFVCFFSAAVTANHSFLTKDDVTSLFLSAHNFSAPSSHPHSSNFLQFFFDTLQHERLKVDPKFIKDTDFQKLFDKTKALFSSTLHYLKTPAPDSRGETADACVDVPPIEVLKSLRDSLQKNHSLLRASFRYYYSTESIQILENSIKIFAEQLLISEGLCLSFEESDTSNPKTHKETINTLSTLIDEIHQLIHQQESKAKELYFPDAAKEVTKQFLSHYSSESFTYFSTEIKSFNEKVAKDLVDYLNKYYRGRNKFAAGVNRAGHFLTGKLPNDSVLQVKWSGWNVFVYRSSLASSFLPVETNIDEIIEAAEPQFCENPKNLNETLPKIFEGIKGVCENFEFCGIWPYANCGEGSTDGNLGMEKHGICDSAKFGGFTVYLGLNEDPEGSPIITENLEGYEIYRKKLIENAKETLTNPSDSDGNGILQELNYTPGLEKIPLSIEFGDEVHLLNEMGVEEAQVSTAAAEKFNFCFSIFVFYCIFYL